MLSTLSSLVAIHSLTIYILLHADKLDDKLEPIFGLLVIFWTSYFALLCSTFIKLPSGASQVGTVLLEMTQPPVQKPETKYKLTQ